MNCKNCGYENERDAIFCEECGVNLGIRRFCKFCGEEIDSVINRCSGCGKKFNKSHEGPYNLFSSRQSHINPMALITFFLSILSIIMYILMYFVNKGNGYFGFIGMILGIVGIIMGVISKKEIKDPQQRGKMLAKIGLILSIVGLGSLFLFMVSTFFLMLFSILK